MNRITAYRTCLALVVVLGAIGTRAVAERYPFMGDWEGQWNPRDRVYPPKIAAPLGTKRAFRDFQLHIEFRNIWIVDLSEEEH